MKRYILDTNILSDLIYRRYGVPDRVMEARLNGGTIATTLPIIGEIYYGANYSNDPEHYLRIVQLRTSRITKWPFTLEAAKMYGEIAATLKSEGKLIQQVDIQTAAIALNLGNCTIVTTDTDFARIPGLSIENWRTPSS